MNRREFFKGMFGVALLPLAVLFPSHEETEDERRERLGWQKLYMRHEGPGKITFSEPIFNWKT